MKRKVISIIVVSAMFLSLFSINISAETINLSGGELLKQYVFQDDVDEEILISDELSIQDEANIYAQYLQSYIDSNEAAKQVYGGRYIDNDGKLHVLFTEKADSNIINTVNAATENSVVIESCKHSLDELTAIKEHISNFMSSEIHEGELLDIADDIAAVGIDEEYNNIFVELIDCNSEKINLFKSMIFDSNIIVFEDSEGYEDNVSYLYPGRAITITTDLGEGTCSMGFRCKKLTSSGSYVKGFMTAGHTISAGDPVYSFGNYIGYVMSRSYTNNGTVDASFVYVTNTYYDVSNTTSHGSHTLAAGTYTNTFSKGDIVYMVGCKTTLASGEISSTSCSVTTTNSVDGTRTTKDCVRAKYSSQGGDSGGAVYMYTGGAYKIAGIHKCAGSNGNSVFVKAGNIKTILQITFY